MRRLAALFLVLGIAVAAAFFADHPGQVEIVWQGWQADTSVGVLIAAVIVLAVLLWTLFAGLAALWRVPRAWRRRRGERRRRRGDRALTRGVIALAAGEFGEARRQAGHAAALLGDMPLSLILAAQAALSDGDEAAARRSFTAMLERRETEFLGLRGLLALALRAGDREAALRYAERARLLRPRTPWLVETLLTLETATARWERAAATLAGAAKRGVVPAARAGHHRGVILHELALAAEARGDLRRAARLAAKAQVLTPDLAAPAGTAARLLLALGRKRAAAKAIERAWRSAPHPDLARLYAAIDAGAAPLAAVATAERLAAQNPAAPESHLLVAEAALAAKLWGEARRHLAAAVSEPQAAPRRWCLLMARLEEGEHGDLGRARDWFERAVAAPPDPTHVCARCAGESAEWHALCPACGAFDALAWRAPARPFPGAAQADRRGAGAAGGELATGAAALALPDPLGGGGAMR